MIALRYRKSYRIRRVDGCINNPEFSRIIGRNAMVRIVGNKRALAVSTASLAIGVYGLARNVTSTLPEPLAKGGHWQFLTNLSLVYLLVVFVVGVAAHATGSQRLFDIKNTLHPIGMALEFVVAVVYWPLRLFFMHLLASDPLKFNLPLLTDLCIHLMPVVSLMIDYLVYMPPWLLLNLTALALMAGLTMGYWSLLKYLIEEDGYYPYAFLNVDTEAQRMVMFVAVGLVAFGSFLAMKMLYGVVVRDSPKLASKKAI